MPYWIHLIWPLVIAFFVAWRARQMGYSAASWFFVSALANPLVALGFLSALPNRSIRKKRKEDMELLEEQLAQKDLLDGEHGSPPLPRYTIGDRSTLGDLSEAALGLVYSLGSSLSMSGQSSDREVRKREGEVEISEPSPLEDQTISSPGSPRSDKKALKEKGEVMPAEARSLEAPPREAPGNWLSRNKGLAIGCGVAAVISACACFCLCLLVVAFIAYFGRQPENLLAEAEYPQVVQEGEEFELVLTMYNTGDTPIVVGDIDLDEMLSASILDGAVVLETEPPMERDFSLQGVKTFKYDRVIPPGESRQATFLLEAIKPGEYGGSIGVYSGDIAYTLQATITVVPK